MKKQPEQSHPDETSNELMWEENHTKILNAIILQTLDNGRPPGKAEIAKRSGLSRQTVDKHMEHISLSQEPILDAGYLPLITNRIITTMMTAALKGNLRAAKMYLELVSKTNQPAQQNTVINNHLNFIQLNNTQVTQETIQKLSPYQIALIEDIINNRIPKIELPVRPEL
jgi:hypothetical protein